jgi:hypothetical protein
MAMRAVAIGGTAILAIIGLKIVMALLGMVVGVFSFILFTVLPLLLIGYLIYKAIGWVRTEDAAEDVQ